MNVKFLLVKRSNFSACFKNYIKKQKKNLHNKQQILYLINVMSLIFYHLDIDYFRFLHLVLPRRRRDELVRVSAFFEDL